MKTKHLLTRRQHGGRGANHFVSGLFVTLRIHSYRLALTYPCAIHRVSWMPGKQRLCSVVAAQQQLLGSAALCFFSVLNGVPLQWPKRRLHRVWKEKTPQKNDKWCRFFLKWKSKNPRAEWFVNKCHESLVHQNHFITVALEILLLVCCYLGIEFFLQLFGFGDVMTSEKEDCLNWYENLHASKWNANWKIEKHLIRVICMSKKV